MTNAEFAATSVEFHRACATANVQPTRRQASKYRNKKGAAYAAR